MNIFTKVKMKWKSFPAKCRIKKNILTSVFYFSDNNESITSCIVAI